MDKNELKKHLIWVCQESELSHQEVREAISDAGIYFMLQENDILKQIPVKNHSEHAEGQRKEKSERLSSFAFGFAIFTLLAVVVIEFVIK